MVVKSLQSCGQQLPPKENALFKRLVKCYELKQYKNGLKFAKQILSNPSFAEHGETLAMKGLLLSSLGKKAEAHSAVDKGLRKNLASIVCWQAYAILHKNDRKYEEAIKGYKLALNRDNNNLEILRDLSVLQVHTRDFDGFLKTRGKILLLQPGLRASWITHAVAFHLLKDYDMALKTLEEFRKTYPVKQFDFEHSEVLLYQNFVMREAGLEAEALQHLATYEGQIVDKLAVQEIRAKMLLNMKDKEEEAVSVCEQLLHRNPDNCDYYRNVELARHPATLEEKLELYRTLSEKYPKAKAPKLLMLEFISGDLFRSEVDKFLVCYLRKGIPPLFKILRSLYSKTEKVEVIEKLVLGYLENLKLSNSFYSNDSQCEQETPTSLLWTYFYLAQHYDFLDQTEKALEYINLALDHTMTLIELYVIKAKICKHAGDINEAVRCLDEAQSLDTADRYVNSKCAKYMLRANMLKEAENMCLKFTKEGSPAADTLHEMQCMWFLLESAALYRRTGQYGEALRKCHEISRHFNEIVEDQFDFHMYCMRKSTIRGYVEILRFEDVLRSHPNYFRAATMAIEIYLHLFDCTQSEAATDNECNQENLTPAELKKLRDKQRKKAKKEAAEKQKQEELHRLQQQRNKAKNYDPDLDGPEQEQLKPERLAKPENPLAEALAFLRTLQQFASNRIETHILAFKIFQRKGKLLLMLQSIKRAFAIEPNNPQLHECIIQFLQAVKAGKSLPELAEKVLLQETLLIFGQKDAVVLNAEFLAKNGNSLPHLLAGARMIFYLDPSKKTEAVSLATNLSPELTGLSLKVCSSVQLSLCNGDFGKCEIEAEDYRAKCRAVFPHAAVFSLTKQNDVNA